MIDIRISEVKMQKTESVETAKNAHRRVQSSTTLNRRYVKRPVKNTDGMISVKRSPKIQHYAPMAPSSQLSTAIQEKPISPATTHPMETTARARMQARKQNMATPQVSKVSAKELKDQAIKKALAAAERTPTMAEQATKGGKNAKKTDKLHFGFGRIALAISCTAAAVFMIAYFVSLNMPDLSLRVAAMQTGISASYPSYVPRDYRLSSITSEEGKIELSFIKPSSDDSFTILEEKSSWDSNALLNNYVKDAFGENYTITREQGLTIYTSDSNAAWVNGGVMYKLTAKNNTLSNKQIRSIVTSL